MNIARKWNTFNDKKLISKRQVAQLFNVSMHTVDRWLHDGKLPEPQRTFPRQKWDYKELVARTSLKVGLRREALIFTCISFGFKEWRDLQVETHDKKSYKSFTNWLACLRKKLEKGD